MELKSIHSPNYRILIQHLRSAREANGITQKQLADLLGCNQTIISKIETLERRIDIIELRTICQKINISFIDFIIKVERDLL